MTAESRGGRIVVGVDGSSGSRSALVWALCQAARRGAEVEVVTAASPKEVYWADAYLMDNRMETIRSDTEALATAMVDEARRDPDVRRVAASSDLAIEVVATIGPAAGDLLQRAENADLLVVGSRGRGALRSSLLGSVALTCVTHAPCQVVVVHPQSSTGSRTPKIVVGVDLTERSRAALAAAVEEATRLEGEVEAVAAYEIGDYWSSLYAIAFPPLEEIRDAILRQAQLAVDQALTSTAMVGRARLPTVRSLALQGRPGDVLVRRSREADLLVVGCHARGGIRGLILGSTALHCVLHADCPVLVVPSSRNETATVPVLSEATARA